MAPVLFPLQRGTNITELGTEPFLVHLPGIDGTNDSYTSIFSSRQVANYRGSYSAVMGAADEAFPQTGVFASAVKARSVEFYRGVPSRTGLVLDTSSDPWAPPATLERAQAFYKPPTTPPSNVYDPATNTFADWTPQPATERQQPNYSPPRSQALPAFTATLDQWAQVTFGRSVPFYKGPAAITISVWDPATNTFADWTPTALLSRAVANYKPPVAQPRVAWGDSIITDQIAAVVLGRAVPLYRPPAIQPQVAWGESIITDQVAPVVLGRAVPFYRNPPPFFALAWGDSVVTDALSPVAQSRQQSAYRAPLAFLTRIYDQPVVATDFVASISSRPVPFYRAGPSSYWVTWDDHACTTLLPDTVLLPDTLLFPDLCPQVELAYVTQSRPVGFYRAPAALVGNVFTPNSVADWASVAQGYRAPFRYLGSASLIVNVYDPRTNTFADWATPAFLQRAVANYHPPTAQPVVAWGQSVVTDQVAPVALGRSVATYRAPLALIVNVYDPATNTFADWTPQPVISRRVPFYAPHGSLFVYAYDGASGIVFYPGGGGFGAEMSGKFLNRYGAGYAGRYTPRYKDTIRRQKG